MGVFPHSTKFFLQQKKKKKKNHAFLFVQGEEEKYKEKCRFIIICVFFLIKKAYCRSFYNKKETERMNNINSIMVLSLYYIKPLQINRS